MTPTKATRATIAYLGTQLEILLMPDSSFRISVPQIAAIEGFGFVKTNAQRDIKALLGKDFSFVKTKVESPTPRPNENTLSIPEFERMLTELAFKGNETAREWVRASVGLTLTSLAHDAHGITFAAEERKLWLECRQQHKQQYHPLLTSWLQVDGCQDYGKQVNIFKAYAGVPLTPVNEYTSAELQKLNTAEIRYDCLRAVGMSHKASLTHLR